MFRADVRACLAVSLLALLVGVACGSEDKEELVPPKAEQFPKVLAFGASSTVIATGQSVTLTWSTENAGSVALADDAGQPVSLDGSAVSAGEVTVWPSATTSYTFTAFGAEDPAQQAFRTVTVAVTTVTEPVEAPEIDSFTASAPLVAVGGEVTLSWSTSKATSLVLADDAGVEVDLTGISVAAGSVVVRPVRSPTTYALVAASGGGQVTETVSVEIAGVPLVHRFSVNPVLPVGAGETISLEWKTSRANRVLIRNKDTNAVIVDTAELEGSEDVILGSSTTFELTATGDGGGASATVLAQVGPKILDFDASPRHGRTDTEITLSWQTSGANAVVLTGPDDYLFQVPEGQLAAGNTRVDLKAGGDYVLTARAGTVARTSSVFVERTDKPIIRSFTSSDSAVTAAVGEASVVAVSWVQEGGINCTIYQGGVVVPGYSDFPCDDGRAYVEFESSADLRLVAMNSAGNDESSLHVAAVAPARIVTFAKLPARRLIPGSTVELSWSVTGADAVRLERDGVQMGPIVFDGSVTETVFVNTTYTLIATNSLGHESVETQEVGAGSAVIEEFAATEPVAIPGDPVTFAWRCDGGDSLVLRDAGDIERWSTTDAGEIDDGKITFAAPPGPGSYTYTLAVTNGTASPTTETFELVVTDGPLVRSLVASQPGILLGSSVDISWVVANGLPGTTPTLELMDDLLVEVPIGDKNVNAGTVTVTPTVEGRRVFRLTATTPGAESSFREVTIDVAQPVDIVRFDADPTEVFTKGGTEVPDVTLSWETANAAEVRLARADASGRMIPGSTFHLLRLVDGATQAKLNEGSFPVHPVVTTRYLLRAVSGVGTTIERLLTVYVDPPRVISFEASPPDIGGGESTELIWKTENATAVMFVPMEWEVTPIANAFADISLLPGAQQIDMVSDNAYQLVPFPADFRFPFDGKLHSAMRVAMNGFISFDLTSTGATNGNTQSIATWGYIHLAPFWDQLASTGSGGLYWHYDDVVRTVTVMWKKWAYYGNSVCRNAASYEYDLNIEVVLHENGDFEYRYGTMDVTTTLSRPAADCVEGADGAFASIGFHGLSASVGQLLHFGDSTSTAYSGGLDNKGWFFHAGVPVNGSRVVSPESHKTYKIVAANDDLSVAASTEVRVALQPVIDEAFIDPVGPGAGQSFSIYWSTSNVTRVRVFDPEDPGTILCETSDPDEVDQGECTHAFSDPGLRSLVVEAINGSDHLVATRTINILVLEPTEIKILHFGASDEFIERNDGVVIAWESIGGFDAELYACAPNTNHNNCVALDISGEDIDAGTYAIAALAESKDFWLRVLDPYGRSVEASVNVWVGAPTVEFDVSSALVFGGTEVTFDWETTGATLASISAPENGNLPALDSWIELSGAPFIDISATGTVPSQVPTSNGSMIGTYKIQFPDGFVFPYFNVPRTSMLASALGWASFNTSTVVNQAANERMPTITDSKRIVHLAPFWDDLSSATGKIVYELTTIEDERVLIIQWSNHQFRTYCNPSSLNFQILLFESGVIEYRYDKMESTSGDNTRPCANWANGSSATIGFQSDDYGLATRAGQTIQHEPSQPEQLFKKAFRLFPGVYRPTGTATAKPTESTTYRICVTNESLYVACKEVRVVVMKNHDLRISELMIRPSDANAEWFELRNVTRETLALGGLTLVSGSRSYEIPADSPAKIAPGAFAVLARSGDTGINGLPASPAVVYGSGSGSDLDFGDVAGDLSVMLGANEIDKVTWSSTWPIIENRSFAREPFNLASANRDDRYYTEPTTASAILATWCASTVTYGNAGLYYGTPGAIGSGCAHQYYSVDRFSTKPFIDISATGEPIVGLFSAPYFTRDNPISLPFGFPFYNQTIEKIYITKLGMIGIDTSNISGNLNLTHVAIPTNNNVTPRGVIAPLWTQTSDAGSAKISWEAREIGGQKVMIVQWTNVDFGSDPSSDYGSMTAQAQLWSNGDIVFAYGPLLKAAAVSDWHSTYGRWTAGYSTIGLEDPATTATTALSIALHSSTSSAYVGPVYEGRAYHFIRKN